MDFEEQLKVGGPQAEAVLTVNLNDTGGDDADAFTVPPLIESCAQADMGAIAKKAASTRILFMG